MGRPAGEIVPSIFTSLGLSQFARDRGSSLCCDAAVAEGGLSDALADVLADGGVQPGAAGAQVQRRGLAGRHVDDHVELAAQGDHAATQGRPLNHPGEVDRHAAGGLAESRRVYLDGRHSRLCDADDQ